MLRFYAVAAAAVVASAVNTPATAQSRSPIMHGGPVVTFPYFDRAAIAPASVRLSTGQQVQARRWQRIGQCVVGNDRGASLSYVAARDGSEAATAAAARLKPAFASCLAGAPIDEPFNRALRRAALADALGVFVPAR